MARRGSFKLTTPGSTYSIEWETDTTGYLVRHVDRVGRPIIERHCRSWEGVISEVGDLLAGFAATELGFEE